METERRSSATNRRAKRLPQQAKTHPIVQAKQNQMYLITTLVSSNDQAPINRKLPNELILRIFSFLDVKSLCRCAQTCRAWNVLALDGSNWQRVDLFTFQRDVKAAVIENLSRRCGGFLKELSLKGCENVHDSALRTFTAKCSNIEFLSLYRCKRVTDASCENLGRHCHKLQHLNLENCSAITDRALKYISDGCKNLRYLNISWCDAIQDKGVQNILINCIQLHTLVLRGCEGLTERLFAPVEKHMGNLKNLNMLSCFVNDDTVSNIANGCEGLEYLCLSNCTHISDRSLQLLASKWTSNCPAASFYQTTAFTQLTKGCKKLQRIDMEDCSLITDVTIQALSTNCSTLRELSLSHCDLITDEAVLSLCTKNKEHLQVLELDNCSLLTDTTLSHLRHARVLKRIDLYDCQNISKEAIQRFRHHRPHVEIHAYFAPATPPASHAGNRVGICRCCVIL
ncbi:unnamed protein product [Caenorhabditis auriculariae]|uniref:F-box domain-containing protein n=1 Tax=Caenorhabditis auriculariae TaxID=2777116 RepID=A0A8S1GZ74_9PELO|nr:unnamed protein product [Caenorhabditis auriculariae]